MLLTLMNPKYNIRFPQPPLGLLHLASYIQERTDWNVKLIDCNVNNYTPAEAVKEISQETDIVGLTGLTPNVNYSFQLAKHIKENLGTPVLLGGPHVTVLPEKTMEKVHSIDIGVVGEGEQTVVEILNAFHNNKVPLSEIDGIIFYNGKELVRTKPRSLIKKLDLLPFPDYSLLEKPLTQYKPFPPHGRELPFMSIVSSRGCPYNCTFCSHSVFGRAYNCFSAVYLYSQLFYLKRVHGIKYVQFYDDSFTLNRNRVLELCRLIKETGTIDIPWSCETRVNLVDRELLEEMRSAGCQLIGFGIESGVQRVLNVLNKQITIEEVENAVKWCNELGITSVGYMMLGAPTETREEMLQSIKFTKSIPIDFVQWSITTPYLGTELYQQALEAGVELPEDWDDWVYVDLANIKRESPIAVANEFLSAKELQELQVKGYIEFYLSMNYVFRRFKKMCFSWREFKTNIKGFRMLREALKK